MIEITDRWVVPLLLFLADWSVRWGLVLAALALWLILRPPRLAATRHTLCLVGLAAGVLLPVVPRWGSVPILWPAPIRSIEIAAPDDAEVLPVDPRSGPVAFNRPERPLASRSGSMSGPASHVKSARAEPSFADRIKACFPDHSTSRSRQPAIRGGGRNRRSASGTGGRPRRGWEAGSGTSIRSISTLAQEWSP